MPNDPDVVRRYLLGEAAEPEAEALERAYLSRQETLEEVEAAEHDLIDEYLSGSLTGQARARFDRHYLASPVHRRRVAVARALRRLGWTRRRRLPLGWISLAAATLLLAALGLWRLELPAERTVVVTLSSVSTRDEGQTPTARLSPSTDRLELRLRREAAGAGPARSGALRTVDGAEIARATASESGDVTLVTFPATGLAAGDYIVALLDDRGAEIRRYYLRVTR